MHWVSALISLGAVTGLVSVMVKLVTIGRIRFGGTRPRLGRPGM
jgi:basic amino acid/polyamine antiporter, APA family